MKKGTKNTGQLENRWTIVGKRWKKGFPGGAVVESLPADEIGRASCRERV